MTRVLFRAVTDLPGQRQQHGVLLDNTRNIQPDAKVAILSNHFKAGPDLDGSIGGQRSSRLRSTAPRQRAKRSSGRSTSFRPQQHQGRARLTASPSLRLGHASRGRICRRDVDALRQVEYNRLKQMERDQLAASLLESRPHLPAAAPFPVARTSAEQTSRSRCWLDAARRTR